MEGLVAGCVDKSGEEAGLMAAGFMDESVISVSILSVTMGDSGPRVSYEPVIFVESCSLLI